MTPEELAKKLTPAALAAQLEPFMQKATLLALRESQPRTPVRTGTLRRSETTRVEAGGLRGFGQGLQGGLQVGKGLRLWRQVHRCFVGFAAGQQAFGGETVPAGFHGFFQGLAALRTLCPSLQLI